MTPWWVKSERPEISTVTKESEDAGLLLLLVLPAFEVLLHRSAEGSSGQRQAPTLGATSWTRNIEAPRSKRQDVGRDGPPRIPIGGR